MINLNILTFSDEISYNMDIMAQTLQKGTAVDIGFLEIFANDIRECREKGLEQGKVTLLQSRLDELSDRAFQVAEKAISEGKLEAKEIGFERVAVPLLGPEVTMEELSETYYSAEIKSALKKLDRDYTYRSIRGDGHCLYRSVLAGSLLSLSKAPESSRLAVLANFRQQIESLGNPPDLVEGYGRFLGVLEKCTAQGSQDSLCAIINDRQKSDQLVQFFRLAAAQWNRMNGSEVFRSEAVLTSGSLETYLSDQSDMQKAHSGGNQELIALSNLLGMTIHVLHLKAIAQGHPVDAEQNRFPGLPAAGTISLLYNPGHYDLAIAKGAN